jgi:hypothetical protein
LRKRLATYLAAMSADNPLMGLPTRIVGDSYADPEEFFTHYDVFAYWLAAHLARTGRRRILDVGSPKMQTAMLSANHDVTSLVLADCSDRFSAVNYLRCDISDPLPFGDASFDCLTSSATLQLVGLGRYGDRLNPNCLPSFVRELHRVMAADADLFVSMCLGPNMLAFNNSWFLDLDKIGELFRGWTLAEALVDTWSSPRKNDYSGGAERRIVKVADAPRVLPGDYKVVFCWFRRGGGNA